MKLRPAVEVSGMTGAKMLVMFDSVGGRPVVVDALPFDLRSGQQRMEHRAGVEFPDRFELVGEVVVVIGLLA